MRWWGIALILIITGVIVGSSYFFTDDWLEEQIEYQASYYNGAKVEIDDFTLSFTGLKIGWQRLQITDPDATMTNLVETGKAEADMAFWPLFFDAVIIENVQLSDARFKTERQTDGAMTFPEPEASDATEEDDQEPGLIAETANELTDKVKATAGMKFNTVQSNINVDSLMAKLDLKTVEKIDSVRSSLESKYQSWEERLNSTNVKKDADQLREKVESIDPKKIKTPKQFKQALETAKSVKSKVDSLRDEAKAIKRNLESDLKAANNLLGSAQNWIEEDYQRAQSLAKLPDISAQNIGQAIFGETFVNQFTEYLGYARTARSYARKLKSSGEEEDQPDRGEGRTIAFSDKYEHPSFWIKQIALSGETPNGLALAGNVTDVVTNQPLIDKTTQFKVEGSQENAAALVVSGVFDYLSDNQGERFEAIYRDFPLKDVTISKSELLPDQIAAGEGKLSAGLDLMDASLTSNVSFMADQVQFVFPETSGRTDRFQQMIASTVKGADQIEFNAKVSGEPKNLNFKLDSNLDDLFLKNLRATISREVEAAKRKIRNEVDQRVDAKKKELMSYADQKKDELLKKAEKLETDVLKDLKIVREKEEEIQKLKDQFKDKVKDKVKNLIDF